MVFTLPDKVMLVNPLESHSNKANAKECYFQPKLRITGEKNNFVFDDISTYSQYGNEDSEELSNRLLYRKKKVYGYGIGK